VTGKSRTTRQVALPAPGARLAPKRRYVGRASEKGWGTKRRLDKTRIRPAVIDERSMERKG
jgi:hypothetical protein